MACHGPYDSSTRSSPANCSDSQGIEQDRGEITLVTSSTRRDPNSTVLRLFGQKKTRFEAKSGLSDRAPLAHWRLKDGIRAMILDFSES